MELILITGFLGAGKTTLLKNLVGLLAPRRLHIIVNEFGKTGVDAQLLQGVRAALTEINNGSVFCSCRLDQFENALEQVLGTDAEVLLVEASGLADPSAITRVLGRPRFAGIGYRGCVCVADAARLHKVAATALMVPRQLAVASLVLLNKADLVDEKTLANAEALVRQYAPGAVVRPTRYAAIQPEWLAQLAPRPKVDAAVAARDITLQKVQLRLAPGVDAAALQAMVARLAPDTWRLKGFVRAKGGALLFVDCVGPAWELRPQGGAAAEEDVLVALAGQGMPLRKTLNELKKWYPDAIEEVTYH